MAKKTKRADGRMQTFFRVNGKGYTVFGKDAAELSRKEHEKREQIAAGIEKRENPTLDQFYERWTESRRSSIKESTLHTQASQYKVCSDVIISGADKRLGDLKLADIIPDDIREVQKALLEKGRKTQTVNDAIAHLRHVFNVGIKEQRITFNPCLPVDSLRRTEEEARDTHHRALSEEEAAAFFQEAQRSNSFYYDVFRFAVNTGMRCGEIGALYNTDISAGMVTVERTITRCEGGGYRIGDSAKTASGRRTIPVNDEILDIVRHQKQINHFLDTDGSNVTKYQDLIFKAPERGLLMSTPVNREIKRICKRCGVEPFTMHAFRATFATWLIAAGVNPRTVQELLGHKDYALTMNLYGHVLDDAKRKAMKSGFRLVV